MFQEKVKGIRDTQTPSPRLKGPNERHQEVLTLQNSVFLFSVIILKFDVSVVITGILQLMHALRGLISPVLYWPLVTPCDLRF